MTDPEFEYSAIIDDETCPVCRAADGMSNQNVKNLPDAPNPECRNGDQCRCMIVQVLI